MILWLKKRRAQNKDGPSEAQQAIDRAKCTYEEVVNREAEIDEHVEVMTRIARENHFVQRLSMGRLKGT